MLSSPPELMYCYVFDVSAAVSAGGGDVADHGGSQSSDPTDIQAGDHEEVKLALHRAWLRGFGIHARQDESYTLWQQ